MTLHPSDIRLWDGLRISSPERLWCELAAVLSVVELVAVGDYLIHRRQPHTTVARLAEAVASHAGRKGVGLLREALPLLNERAESPRETRLRVLAVRGGVAGIVVNLPITTTGGYGYRGDLAIPSRKMLIEYQSDYHRDPAQYRADLTRISRLEADGWYVMQVGAGDFHDPDELVARIHRLVAQRPHFG